MLREHLVCRSLLLSTLTLLALSLLNAGSARGVAQQPGLRAQPPVAGVAFFGPYIDPDCGSAGPHHGPKVDPSSSSFGSEKDPDGSLGPIGLAHFAIARGPVVGPCGNDFVTIAGGTYFDSYGESSPPVVMGEAIPLAYGPYIDPDGGESRPANGPLLDASDVRFKALGSGIIGHLQGKCRRLALGPLIDPTGGLDPYSERSVAD